MESIGPFAVSDERNFAKLLDLSGEIAWNLRETLRMSPLEAKVFLANNYFVNPAGFGERATRDEIIWGRPTLLVVPTMDFNNYISFGRAGISPTRTFLHETESAFRNAITRFGSCNIGTALDTAAMVSHLAKHPDLAPGIIVSTENGMSWGFTKRLGDNIVMQEYHAPLSKEQTNALEVLKASIEVLALFMRKCGIIAFVNFEKFSKCTLETCHNGKAWHQRLVAEALMPQLEKCGAIIDSANSFVLGGIGFQVSCTAESVEIDMKRGADTVGKRMIRNIMLATIEEMLYTHNPTVRFFMLTGGDSAKWGGSDGALTDNNYPVVGFWAPPQERLISELRATMEEASAMARYYWPGFIMDDGEPRLFGAGRAPAFYLNNAPYAMPCLNLPVDELIAGIIRRITQYDGFVEDKKWDLMFPPPPYNFPADLSGEQRKTFLASIPDLPQNKKKQQELLAELKAKLQV